MQNPPLFLHKQVKNIQYFPFRIRKSHHLRVKIGIPMLHLTPMPSSPMAIGLLLDGHPSHTQMAIRPSSDGHSPSVRCPSDGVETLLFHLSIRQALVRCTLSACGFSSFQDPYFPFPFITQQLTPHDRIKIRVFPSKLFLARKYAIPAFGIYSLTF